MKYRPLSLLLFILDVYADSRVDDLYGAAFWALALFIFGFFSLGSHTEFPKTHRWLGITWDVLILFAVAVIFIRLVFGYSG